MERVLRRVAVREAVFRHTDGRVFARAFMEKEFMARRADASAVRRGDRGTRRRATNTAIWIQWKLLSCSKCKKVIKQTSIEQWRRGRMRWLLLVWPSDRTGGRRKGRISKVLAALDFFPYSPFLDSRHFPGPTSVPHCTPSGLGWLLNYFCSYLFSPSSISLLYSEHDFSEDVHRRACGDLAVPGRRHQDWLPDNLILGFADADTEVLRSRPKERSSDDPFSRLPACLAVRRPYLDQIFPCRHPSLPATAATATAEG